MKISELPDDIREVCYQRIREQIESEGHTINGGIYEFNLRSKTYSINQAFTWDNTPEGHNYWRQLYNE